MSKIPRYLQGDTNSGKKLLNLLSKKPLNKIKKSFNWDIHRKQKPRNPDESN